MSRQTAQRPAQTFVAPSSATTTITNTPSHSSTQQITLRLRAERDSEQEQPPARRIRWAEGTVNNEGMGKKSSKVCCIYHKPREVGESSSEESDSSSSDSDRSDNDDGAARPSQRNGRHGDHDHCDHDHRQSATKSPQKSRRGTPNAYEKQPKTVGESSKLDA